MNGGCSGAIPGPESEIDTSRAVPPSGKQDPAARSRVVQGVGDRIVERLFEPERVRVEGETRRHDIRFDCHATAGGSLLAGRLDLVEDVVDGEPFESEPAAACGEPRRVPKVSDEPLELAAFAHRDAESLALQR